MSRATLGRGLALCLVAMAPLALGAEPAEQRWVAVGPAITETVIALGQGARLVGVDDTSMAVPGAASARRVGYQRALSAEGLLSLRPTKVVATEEAGPPAVLEQLRGAGVDVVIVPNTPTVEAARRRIREVARLLGRVEQGEALVTAMNRELEQAATRSKSAAPRPRVLALYARGAGNWMVAGAGTAADQLIQLAGGVNTVAAWTGTRPLTQEAVIEAAPDFILLPEGSLPLAGGVEGLSRVPGLALVKGWRVVTVEDVHFMGLGPRLGTAVNQLGERLHAPAPARRAP
ncbi:ABC transporter substrate-binding protein [Corallococcus sp. M34]|uniref:heme/hemin ABC transporter substrate-binding protein n=1 Tax=Citreicoccus inhibens TaxID=2849499 RepID=UPI001C24C7BE|nr:helical backbone metal receptor [Citreicoccus inhibens]MBU8894466.1 ABC transporter substrate-binding protein [Citreicoccus inhibens]